MWTAARAMARREARRRRPPACGRPPANHARMARHKGGRSTTTPLPHMRACTCVRSTQPQEARLERPSSLPRSRPASSEQAHRASSVGSHLEAGGREGARAVTTSEYDSEKSQHLGGYWYVTTQDGTSRSESLGLRRLVVVRSAHGHCSIPSHPCRALG